jgi:hypothetical protein
MWKVDCLQTRAQGKKMTFEEAVRQGLMDSSLLEQLRSESGLKDDLGRNLPVQEALQQGRLNLHSGHVVDMRTSAMVTIEEAVGEGLISGDSAARLLHLSSPMVSTTIITTEVKPVPLNVLQPNQYLADDQSKPGSSSGSNIHLIPVGVTHDHSKPQFEEHYYKEEIDKYSHVSDTGDKEEVEWKKVEDYHAADGVEVMSVYESKVSHVAHPSQSPFAADVPRNMPLFDALNGGVLDKHTGRFHGVSGKIAADAGPTLQDGVNHGIINPDSALFQEPATNQRHSLKEALDAHLIDSTGHYVDKSSHKLYDLDALIAADLLRPVEGKVPVIIESKGSPVTPTGGNTAAGKPLGTTEAARPDAIKPGEQRKDKVSVDVPSVLSSSEAKKGLEASHVSKETDPSKKATPASEDRVPMSLAAAVKLGLYDVRNGQCMDPSSGVKMSLPHALAAGIVDSKQPAIVDLSSGQAINLDDAVKQGLIDTNTGLLNEKAIKAKGLHVDPLFTPSHFIVRPIHLLDAVQSRLCSSSLDTCLDPRSGLKVPFSDWLSSGLIDGQSVNVLNPLTQQMVPLIEAEHRGLLNKKTGDLIDSKTGTHLLTLSEAVDAGLVQTAIDAGALQWTNPVSGSQEPLADALRNKRIPPENVQVYDSANAIRCSLQTALNSKLIDPKLSQVKFGQPEKQLPLSEALERDVVHVAGTPVLACEPVTVQPAIFAELQNKVDAALKRKVDTSKTLLQPAEVSDIKQSPNQISSSSPSQVTSDLKLVEKPTIAIEEPAVVGFDEAAEDELRPQHAVETAAEPAKAEEKLKDGVLKTKGEGVEVDYNTGDVVDGSGRVLTADETVRLGLIDDAKPQAIKDESAKKPEYRGDKVTLNDALTQDLVDLPLALIEIPNDGRKVTIGDAIDIGLLDAEKSIIIDPSTGEVITVADAINRGIMDPSTGSVTNATTGAVLTLAEMAMEGLIPQFGLNFSSPLPFALAQEQGLVDMEAGTYRDPSTGQLLPLDRAIELNLLVVESADGKTPDRQQNNENNVEQMDADGVEQQPNRLLGLRIGESVSDTLFNDAQRSGDSVMHEDDALTGLTISKGIDWNDALKQNLINLENNTYLDPKTGILMPLDDAIKNGYLLNVPSSVLKELLGAQHGKDSEMPELGSLNVAITDPHTGEQIPLQEAIDRGIVFDGQIVTAWHR